MASDKQPSDKYYYPRECQIDRSSELKTEIESLTAEAKEAEAEAKEAEANAKEVEVAKTGGINSSNGQLEQFWEITDKVGELDSHNKLCYMAMSCGAVIAVCGGIISAICNSLGSTDGAILSGIIAFGGGIWSLWGGGKRLTNGMDKNNLMEQRRELNLDIEGKVSAYEKKSKDAAITAIIGLALGLISLAGAVYGAEVQDGKILSATLICTLLSSVPIIFGSEISNSSSEELKKLR